MCVCTKERGTHGHQFKVLKVLVAAVAGAAERLLDAQAGGAHAVGDVDYAGELLELEEELAADGGIVAGCEWSLRLRLRLRLREDTTADEDEEGEHVGEEAESAGHGQVVLHVLEG